MPERTFKGRAVQKHAVEADWLKATNFVPLKGEMIIYDPDADHTSARLKVGDGVTLVNGLPFVKNDCTREVLSDAQPTGMSEGDAWLKPIQSGGENGYQKSSKEPYEQHWLIRCNSL